MFDSKADVVRQLSFVEGVYGKVKTAGFYRNNEPVDLCGVIFAGQWAFSTNGHFLIRLRVPDRMPDGMVFYQSGQGQGQGPMESIRHGREVLEDISCLKIGDERQATLFYEYASETWKPMPSYDPQRFSLESLHRFFFNWHTDAIVFSRNLFIDEMDKIFRSSSEKKLRQFLSMKLDVGSSTLIVRSMNAAKEAPEKEASFSIPAWQPERKVMNMWGETQPVINVGCFYFYELLATFKDQSEDVVLTFNAMEPRSIVSAINLFAYKDGGLDDDVAVALASVKPQYVVRW